MRKKLRNFRIRTKNEESRKKELMIVNERIMAKIRVIENNNCKNKVFMPKNTSSKGREMEKSKVVVDETENLKKELFEIKKKIEAREEKLKKEILRKEGVINRLHEETNVAYKKLKEDEIMKEREENVVEIIKKEKCLLKKENQDISNVV